MDNQTIAHTYFLKRNQEHISQKEISERLGISREAYRKIEIGKTPILHRLYEKINRELNLTDLDFVGEEFSDYTLLKQQVEEQKTKIEELEKIIAKKDKQIDDMTELLELHSTLMDKMRKYFHEQDREPENFHDEE